MILVFGGNGQLGRELARAAALQAIPMETLSHVEVDIANSAAVASVLSRIKPTLVVNAAAYTNVDLAETNVEEARRANEIGPAVLARACADAQLPMVHVSTDYVFDGTKEGAYLETDSVCPINVIWSDQGGGRTGGPSHARSVISLCAPRGSIVSSGTIFSRRSFASQQTRDELRVVADQHGTPTSAREMAEAILRIAPRLVARNSRSGAGVGHISFHCGGRDHLARFCEPHRRSSGAAHWPQSARDADHDGGLSY